MVTIRNRGKVLKMRQNVISMGAVILTVLAFTGMAAADHADDTNQEDGVFHGWGTGPLLIVSIFIYWALAIPIGLLVYTDAKERRMDARRWLLLTMIPFVGVLTVVPYVYARRDHPRTDVYDPWAEGDRALEIRQARGEGN